jgi:uridine phosphorylase
MLELTMPAATVGVVGCAVGASFAVLVAEELFASGCRVLISITSAGQLVPAGKPPYFVVIDRALRDEGTSHHYLPPTPYAHALPQMLALSDSLSTGDPPVIRGGSWTTEMEAAALYALAEAKAYPIICFAHVTNRMATVENDFEKGEANGNKALIELLGRIIQAWRERS